MRDPLYGQMTVEQEQFYHTQTITADYLDNGTQQRYRWSIEERSGALNERMAKHTI